MAKIVIYNSNGTEKVIDTADITFMAVFGGALTVEYTSGRQENLGSDVDLYFEMTINEQEKPRRNEPTKRQSHRISSIGSTNRRKTWQR